MPSAITTTVQGRRGVIARRYVSSWTGATHLERLYASTARAPGSLCTSATRRLRSAQERACTVFTDRWRSWIRRNPRPAIEPVEGDTEAPRRPR